MLAQSSSIHLTTISNCNPIQFSEWNCALAKSTGHLYNHYCLCNILQDDPGAVKGFSVKWINLPVIAQQRKHEHPSTRMLIKAAYAYAPNCRKRYESLCPTTQSRLTWSLGAQLMLRGKTDAYRNGPVARKRMTGQGRPTLALCYLTILRRLEKKPVTSWSGARNPVLEQENCL